MSAPSSIDPIENLIGHSRAVRSVRQDATREKWIGFFAKSAENLSRVRSHWAAKVRDYSRRAAENSDEWAERHLRIISFIAAAVGLVLGVFFALP